MLPPRVIPSLLLKDRGLVKTIQFKNPTYVGDPRNAVKIFNEKQVDELALLDIGATAGGRIQWELIHEIVTEAFMPIAYGGGLRTVDECRRVLASGVEKVVINTQAVENPEFISAAAKALGSQSVVVSIDARADRKRRHEVYTHGGQRSARVDPVTHARRMEARGAGELLVASIDREGTMLGYDLDLLKAVSDSVDLPVIASGGARSVTDLAAAIHQGGASAAAAGSMFVFQGRHRAVLISFPSPEELQEAFANRVGGVP